MADNFNLRKFLTENKLTRTSRLLTEEGSEVSWNPTEQKLNAIKKVVDSFILKTYKEGLEEYRADRKEYGDTWFSEDDITYSLVPDDWEGEDIYVSIYGDRGGWDISVEYADPDAEEDDYNPSSIMAVVNGVVYDEDNNVVPVEDFYHDDEITDEEQVRVEKLFTDSGFDLNKPAYVTNEKGEIYGEDRDEPWPLQDNISVWDWWVSAGGIKQFKKTTSTPPQQLSSTRLGVEIKTGNGKTFYIYQ